MKALIDGDIFLHEIGWSCQFADKETGEEILLDMEMGQQMLDDKVNIIMQETGADDVLFFLSDSQELTNQINREKRFLGWEKPEFIENFRYGVAKTKPYKGTRIKPKPFHFNNILSYIRTVYPYQISSGGLEADDELGIYQCEARGRGIDTTICSRDKDVRMVPGNHYSWECGFQNAIGPEYTDEFGRLLADSEGKFRRGYGDIFFYYQLLAGDTVDNIPGLRGCGSVAAYKLLKDVETSEEGYNVVKQAYIDKLGGGARDYFLEQAQLLWIWRTREHGYTFPKKA